MAAKGYKYALQWLIDNEDNDWLDDVENGGDEPTLVSAALVADLYGKTDDELRTTLRGMLKRARQRRSQARMHANGN